jgi:hypothetical protein
MDRNMPLAWEHWVGDDGHEHSVLPPGRAEGSRAAGLLRPDARLCCTSRAPCQEARRLWPGLPPHPED